MPANSAFLQSWLEPLLGRWLYADSVLWTVIGFMGAAIFGSRFVLQWLQSEKEKKLVVPWYFWHLSFWGSVLNLLYFLHLDKAPLILGNCFLPVLYGRNILFLRREGTRGGRKVFAAVAVLILAGFAWTAFFGEESKPVGSADQTAKIRLEQIATAIKVYQGGRGKLPEGDTRTVLRALVEGGMLPSESQFVTPEGDWLDPWSRPYQVLTSGKDYLVRSAGPNGVFDDFHGEVQDDLVANGQMR